MAAGITDPELIEAFAAGDRPRLAVLLAESPAGRPVWTLLHFLVGQEKADWAAFDSSIDDALSTTNEAPDLHACLLAAVLRRLIVRGRQSELPRLMVRLESMLPQLRIAAVRLMVRRRGFAVAQLQMDLAEATRIATCALAETAAGSDAQLEFAAKLAPVCIANCELHRARSLIELLRPHGQRLQAWGFDVAHVTHLEDIADIVCGQAENVLHRPRSRPLAVWMQVWALINARRYGEAERGLAALDATTDADERMHALPLRCLLALDQKSYAVVDAMLRDIAPEQRDPLLERTLAECGMRADLARRQGDRARTALSVLDPTATATMYLLDRSRLALIDGDRHQAAAYFAAFQALGPSSMIDHAISRAPDLQPAVVNRLRAHIRSPVAAAKPTDGALTHVATRSSANPDLIGTSHVMVELRRLIQTCAALSQPVLLVGETGTGKEIAARLLHRQSPRAAAPFLVLNCAGLTDSLAEAELFGHLRGAFTGAIADASGLIQAAGHGSLFLDEIDSLSPRMQGLLLRLLESGDYHPIGASAPRQADCRFICACHNGLDTEGFRTDLRFRLERLVIPLPPLRQHREDIPALCRHFLQRLTGTQILDLDAGTLARFQAADWPGNVRELRNAVERLALLGQTGPVARTVTPPARRGRSEHTPQPSRVPGPPRARQRRTRILELFNELTEVYPADAIAAVGCAANTVTADLLALEAAGLIRRDRRSGHARLNPYVLV